MSDTTARAKARAFIDKNGGYQTAYTGVDKEAHDAWIKTTSWDLTRDDFIRLSYFNGCLENGSDGSGPINGSENSPDDAVYISEDGHALTRAMVSYWLNDYNAFTHGFKVASDALKAVKPPEPLSDAEIDKIALDIQVNCVHLTKDIIREVSRALLSRPTVTAPIDMILYCPNPDCGLQHVDAPDERTPDWKNEPHRSHLCHGCGHIWRPADVATNGVKAIKTVGKDDTPTVTAEPTEPDVIAVLSKLAQHPFAALHRPAKEMLQWIQGAEPVSAPVAAKCLTCNNSGIVGRPPDDYFNCPDCVPVAETERFFQEHGIWHDRVTGQHIYTQDQYDELRRDAFHNGYASRNEEIAALSRAPDGQEKDCYYLASFKRRDSAGIVTWWMPNNAGYTPYLGQAGIYRKDELKADYHDSEYTVPVPVSFVRQFEQRLVDAGMSICDKIFWNAENLRAAIAKESRNV